MNRSGAVPVADVVPTPELVRLMVQEKPACWTWAVYASVLFQRCMAVEERKIIQALGAPVPTTGHLQTGPEVAQFVGGHLRAVDDTLAELDAFLKSSVLAGAFGNSDDETTADADGIVQAAHYLSDLYERLLGLAENCRKYSVPQRYADLLRDCIRFMNEPLQDYCGFINDVLERLEQVQNRVMLGQKYIHQEAILYHATIDDDLVWSILDRLQTIE
ncbi:hypothetical protein BH11ACT6_BH11ACT6_40530 [soil metagenome]